MKKSRILFLFLFTCFILLVGAIILVKVQPGVKKSIKRMVGIEEKKKNINFTNNTHPISSHKPPKIASFPSFKLVDQGDNDFEQNRMAGSISLIHFMCTACLTSSNQMETIVALQSKLANYPVWNDVEFLSVTGIDAQMNSEELQEYARTKGLSLKNWKFLHGSQESIKQIKNDILEAITKQSDKIEDSLHSSMLVLVDRKGFIRGRYNSESAKEMDLLTRQIRAVILEKEGRIAYPESVITPFWLDKRKEQQMATVKDFNVFHQFQFEDQFDSSGINFRHQIPDACAAKFSAVHYDHANGIAVADVDGDNLLDIYFVSQIGKNQLWKNLGNGRFKDITSNSGLEINDAISVGVSFADTDNDGDPDLFVTTVQNGNRFFENKGQGVFEDRSKQSGLHYKGHSSGAVFFDYDKDGLLDLLVTNVGEYTVDSLIEMEVNHPNNPLQNGSYTYHAPHKLAFSGHLNPERAERSLLYRNQGNNNFEEVTEKMKINEMGWNGDASLLDVNNDGWIDLYLTNMQGNDACYQNRGGMYFEKVSEKLFPKTPWGAMGLKVFDYNNDGNQDIYITDMHSDMFRYVSKPPELSLEKTKSITIQSPEYLLTSDTIFGNALFKGKNNETFEEVSDQVNAENFWPWGLSIGDLNADGYEDVFITSSMNYPFRYAVNSLLLNNKGERFMDSEFIVGVEPRPENENAKFWFKLDCDGENKDHSLCKGKSGEQEVWSATGSRSSVLVDIDNDGDLDIITCEFNAEPLLLISNLSEQKESFNYLKMKLIGSKSNKDGLGAKIVVKTASTKQTKVNDGKSGYLSQSSIPLYFGLGEDREIEQIEVVWPSGAKQLITENIPLNDLLIIKEQ